MNHHIHMINDDIISLRIPIKIKQSRGKKHLLLPDGTVADAASSTAKPDTTMVNAITKAWYWQHQIDIGRYPSMQALSQQQGINSSYLSRILRLNQLAPQIKTAILDGSHPPTLGLQAMMTPFPDPWPQQLSHFGFH